VAVNQKPTLLAAFRDVDDTKIRAPADAGVEVAATAGGDPGTDAADRADAANSWGDRMVRGAEDAVDVAVVTGGELQPAVPATRKATSTAAGNCRRRGVVKVRIDIIVPRCAAGARGSVPHRIDGAMEPEPARAGTGEPRPPKRPGPTARRRIGGGASLHLPTEAGVTPVLLSADGSGYPSVDSSTDRTPRRKPGQQPLTAPKADSQDPRPGSHPGGAADHFRHRLSWSSSRFISARHCAPLHAAPVVVSVCTCSAGPATGLSKNFFTRSGKK